MAIRRLAGNRQRFTAKISAEVLWSSEHRVVWVIAEIPETASREYPKAKHGRSTGKCAIAHLLLAAAVAHHDVRTAAWGGRAATSDVRPQQSTKPSHPSLRTGVITAPAPSLHPQNAAIPGAGQAVPRGHQHELCRSFRCSECAELGLVERSGENQYFLGGTTLKKKLGDVLGVRLQRGGNVVLFYGLKVRRYVSIIYRGAQK